MEIVRPGDVIVLDNNGRTDCTVWGDILTMAAKLKGISGTVIEGVCRETSITPHLPLWGEDQHKLMEEFIDAGFSAIVVAAKVELFGEEILGKKIDKTFLASLGKDITPCGEAGEYHTLVVDGPIFKKRLELRETSQVLRDGIHFLEISDTVLKDKA